MTDHHHSSLYCDECDHWVHPPDVQAKWDDHVRGTAHTGTAVPDEQTTTGLATSTRIAEALAPLINLSAAREEDHKYDGVFSYAMEWHAFLFGLVIGIWWAHDPTVLNLIAGLVATAFGAERVGSAVKQVPKKYVHQITQEVHYFGGGVVLGKYLIVYGPHGDKSVTLPIGEVLGALPF